MSSPNRYQSSRSSFLVTKQIPIFQEAFFEYHRTDRQFPGKYPSPNKCFRNRYRWLLSNIPHKPERIASYGSFFSSKKSSTILTAKMNKTFINRSSTSPPDQPFSELVDLVDGEKNIMILRDCWIKNNSNKPCLSSFWLHFKEKICATQLFNRFLDKTILIEKANPKSSINRFCSFRKNWLIWLTKRTVP